MILFNQAIRLKRNRIFEKDFNRHLVNMKELFLARRYPEKTIKEQIKPEVFGKTDKTGVDFTKRVPFVVIFNLKLTFVAKKIKELSKYLLLDLQVKVVFTPITMVSFCSARKK